MCEQKRKVFLTGIGMGTKETMTAEAEEAILSADCLIGAERMLRSVCGEMNRCTAQEETSPEKPFLCEYDACRIREWLRAHPEYKRAVVLLSGDTGFYSGARKLSLELEKLPGCRTALIPGISSVVYLAAKLGTSWEDAALVSMHGKDCNFVSTISRNRKTFFLLGGAGAGEKLLRGIREFGLTEVVLHAGTRLSYPDEKIVSGTAEELREEDLSGLCTVLAENPLPQGRVSCHVRDEEFVRGDVPMTKAEVRAVSIAALELTRDAVVYDVGAGTGSVSVEAALSGEEIRVYAVEKNPRALELLEENRRKFFADGIRIVAGTAPEALGSLETPTHVFIGGSSGNLREILAIVREKNPDVRIVLNAISLETLREALDAAEEGLLPDAEVTQIAASRARKLGRYHMMTGLNPVYIISAGGRREA